MADALCDEYDVLLVVDDEVVMEELIEALVERRGCHHASFHDSVAALQYYRAHSATVTLMITDLIMPGLSGPDLITEALRIKPSLPVILMTGDFGEAIPDGLRPLLHRILTKPFSRADLFEAVSTALVKADHRHPGNS